MRGPKYRGRVKCRNRAEIDHVLPYGQSLGGGVELLDGVDREHAAASVWYALRFIQSGDSPDAGNAPNGRNKEELGRSLGGGDARGVARPLGGDCGGRPRDGRAASVPRARSGLAAAGQAAVGGAGWTGTGR